MIVKDIDSNEKKLFINVIGGDCVSTDWFNDEERKNILDQETFTEKEKEKYEELIRRHNINKKNIINWSVTRRRDDNEVYISRHAFQRADERLGWNKKTTIRMVEKVLEKGTPAKNVKGDYKPFILDRLSTNPNADIFLYGDTAFIFDKNILITVIKAKKYKFEGR